MGSATPDILCRSSEEQIPATCLRGGLVILSLESERPRKIPRPKFVNFEVSSWCGASIHPYNRRSASGYLIVCCCVSSPDCSHNGNAGWLSTSASAAPSATQLINFSSSFSDSKLLFNDAFSKKQAHLQFPQQQQAAPSHQQEIQYLALQRRLFSKLLYSTKIFCSSKLATTR